MTLYPDARPVLPATHGPSRRGSMAALGAAAIALLAGAPTASARRKKRKNTNRKSCKKTIRKEVDQSCGEQVGQCEDTFALTGAPEIIPCCASLATCDFAAFFTCGNSP